MAVIAKLRQGSSYSWAKLALVAINLTTHPPPILPSSAKLQLQLAELALQIAIAELALQIAIKQLVILAI